jgi:HAD superfamily hydrolase (TIGR01549 family)
MGIETPGNLMYSWLDWMHLDDDLARIYNALSKLPKKQRPGNYWLVPGVPEMLAILHKHYPLAIVSARDSTSTLAFLDHFDLRSFFPVIATSQTCTHTKPYADPILWTASQLGVAPEACLMIGDTTVDIKAGKFAGAQTLGVLCGFGSEKEIRRAGADHILPSTRDLPTLLLQPEQAVQ